MTSETVIKFPIVKHAVTGKITPTRSVRLHNDGSAQRAELRIAKMLGMPECSIRIVYPSGKRARKDATVKHVRLQWMKVGA